MKKYSIGIDFVTEEARMMLVDMEGKCIRDASFRYPHGVMTEMLPDGTPLPAAFALQHPLDYVEALDVMLGEIFSEHGECGKNVVGIGVDFTQCTMVPVDKKGVPLCLKKEFQSNPYAYAKLWKHHGGQKQAEKLTETARKRKEKFLDFYGGEIYAESMFPKILETYEKAPEVYREADQFVELADWITFYLTGSRKRSCSIAGCAALWNPQDGYPSEQYFEEAAAGFGSVVREKLTEDLAEVGTTVGYLRKELARKYGLPEGIPVAAGLGDCQAAFVGVGLGEEHVLLSVMGTSSCDMLVSREGIGITGMYGVSYGSMLPGLYGYEAGQATMGDLFKWFLGQWVPQSYYKEAENRNISIFDYLNELAAQYRPGQTGLLALDWWNGNRSVLLDTDLSGMILGMHMNTKCEEIYRTLAESLAFGKRRIIQQFETYGIRVDRLYATGGVANKNPFLMQMFADITGIPVYVSAVENGSCLGSAVYGMTAGGGYENLTRGAQTMGQKPGRVYNPDESVKKAYDELYEEYSRLYDYFGKQNPVMKRLKGWIKRRETE